ncbi:type IV pilus biogenesis/stability protein PilW [Neisseria sp. Ec49-e6-T10]|uniref:type IV pilus biogenesis/stability protein PilW n=1 Tax=Neisseria sp. Ec49-e6-T10 TaxID=3140744 RepID=UPI003EB82814
MSKSENLARIKTNLAVEFLKMGDTRNAISSINEAVRADSHFLNAWLIRAQIYQYIKMPAQVEESFRRALSISAGSGEVNNNYGWYLCENNQVDKSIGYFDKALGDMTYGGHYIVWMNKGICLGRLGHYEEANSALLTSIRQAPGFYFSLKELAKLNLNHNNGSLAEVYFQQYVNQAPGLGPDDLLLGVKIGRLNNKYDWVARYGDQLRQQYPTSQELQDMLSGK